MMDFTTELRQPSSGRGCAHERQPGSDMWAQARGRDPRGFSFWLYQSKHLVGLVQRRLLFTAIRAAVTVYLRCSGFRPCVISWLTFSNLVCFMQRSCLCQDFKIQKGVSRFYQVTCKRLFFTFESLILMCFSRFGWYFWNVFSVSLIYFGDMCMIK